MRLKSHWLMVNCGIDQVFGQIDLGNVVLMFILDVYYDFFVMC